MTVCRCLVQEPGQAPRRCGRAVEVVRHYRGERPPESWALCAACDAQHERLEASYVLPLVVIEVGSELHLALECAFAILATACGWHVAPHGTDENPHVWFLRPDEGPTAARCPCGRVTGWFANDGELLPKHLGGGIWSRPCPDRECDLGAGHEGAHYARWPEGHGNIGERSW